MNIVIVESPAKAKTINKYLGSSYEVLASFGHVRDLPAKNGSVDPDANFKMIWEVDPKAAGRLNDIAKSLKNADRLILATDPDREGEAISWHVLEVLKEKRALKDQKIERVVFNAITKQAVTDAMKHPRQIDGALVDAYLARRALDYLVGFTLSPVLWRKLPGARSAGRVQSVALRLVCDRELEIEKFVAREYWSLIATLLTPRGDAFEARLVGADGKKIQRLDIGTGAEAEDFKKALEAAAYAVDRGRGQAGPAQSAGALHHLDAAAGSLAASYGFCAGAHDAHRAAALRRHRHRRRDRRPHHLYAYRRRADRSVARSPRRARLIGEDYGDAYVPDAAAPLPGQGQERPGSARSDPPDRHVAPPRQHEPQARCRPGAALRADLEAHHREPDGIGRARAHHGRHHAKAGGRTLELRATGSVVKFDGFLALYQEGRDDERRGRGSAAACRR